MEIEHEFGTLGDLDNLESRSGGEDGSRLDQESLTLARLDDVQDILYRPVLTSCVKLGRINVPIETQKQFSSRSGLLNVPKAVLPNES